LFPDFEVQQNGWCHHVNSKRSLLKKKRLNYQKRTYYLKMTKELNKTTTIPN